MNFNLHFNTACRKSIAACLVLFLVVSMWMPVRAVGDADSDTFPYPTGNLTAGTCDIMFRVTSASIEIADGSYYLRAAMQDDIYESLFLGTPAEAAVSHSYERIYHFVNPAREYEYVLRLDDSQGMLHVSGLNKDSRVWYGGIIHIDTDTMVISTEADQEVNPVPDQMPADEDPYYPDYPSTSGDPGASGDPAASGDPSTSGNPSASGNPGVSGDPVPAGFCRVTIDASWWNYVNLADYYSRTGRHCDGAPQDRIEEGQASVSGDPYGADRKRLLVFYMREGERLGDYLSLTDYHGKGWEPAGYDAFIGLTDQYGNHLDPDTIVTENLEISGEWSRYLVRFRNMSNGEYLPFNAAIRFKDTGDSALPSPDYSNDCWSIWVNQGDRLGDYADLFYYNELHGGTGKILAGWVDASGKRITEDTVVSRHMDVEPLWEGGEEDGHVWHAVTIQADSAQSLDYWLNHYERKYGDAPWYQYNDGMTIYVNDGDRLGDYVRLSCMGASDNDQYRCLQGWTDENGAEVTEDTLIHDDMTITAQWRLHRVQIFTNGRALHNYVKETGVREEDAPSVYGINSHSYMFYAAAGSTVGTYLNLDYYQETRVPSAQLFEGWYLSDGGEDPENAVTNDTVIDRDLVITGRWNTDAEPDENTYHEVVFRSGNDAVYFPYMVNYTWLSYSDTPSFVWGEGEKSVTYYIRDGDLLDDFVDYKSYLDYEKEYPEIMGRFLGWFRDDGKQIEPNTVVDRDMTFTGKWRTEAGREEIIYLPEDLKVLSSKAFENTAASVVYVPEGTEIIESGAFNGCDLREVVFLGDDTVIREGAFETAGDELILFGPDRSTAQAYAEEHGILFVCS